MTNLRDRFNSLPINQLGNPLLHAAGLIVVIGLFVWFILLPKYNAYSEIKSGLAVAQQEKLKLEADTQQLNELVDKLQNSESDIKLLDEALPLTDRATRLTVLLESYATSSGLQLAQVNVDNIDANISAGDKTQLEKPFENNRKLNTSKVTISVIGEPEQFRNFLELLDKSGRIIDVDNLEVITAEDLVKYSITVKTYSYLVAPEPVGEDDPSLYSKALLKQ